MTFLKGYESNVFDGNTAQEDAVKEKNHEFEKNIFKKSETCLRCIFDKPNYHNHITSFFAHRSHY